MTTRLISSILVVAILLSFTTWTSLPSAGTAAKGPLAAEHDEEHGNEEEANNACDPQEWLQQKLKDHHSAVLLLILVLAVAALGKGADWLVEDAVELSLRSGVPRVVVGATIVSLGTTAPEAVVSVLAALQGAPGLALGNAVGSIICDTGLILGLACLISPLSFNRLMVNRQGWIQFGCGVLLVAACVPWDNLETVFDQGGNLPRYMGYAFVGLLAVYMIWSVKIARGSFQSNTGNEVQHEGGGIALLLAKLICAVAIVVVASAFLIAAATILAERWAVPQSIIAATIVALGTSTPELIVALTAAWKNQGELAVGNVIGADILNVLFVAGAAAAVTPNGLQADNHFFTIQFPGMLFILLVFRIGIWTARNDRLSRFFGVVLLAAYVIVTVVSYTMRH